jgi:hypothetical protein
LRLTLWAALVVVIRHLAFRGPSLWRRLSPVLDAARTTVEGVLDRAGAVRVSGRELCLVTGMMMVLTVVMTYPQIRRLDAVTALGDPLFSLWRLKWIAHQLPADPLHLFDGNIFYPERYTLAFSDSMLLPALVAAPFLWLGVPAVPLYNILLLMTFVFAGVAMYVLVRTLTGQVPAALVAAIVFAFYPFRFEHYPHFELQFSFWMPLVLLALHRTLAHGRLRDGLLLGAALGAQTLSSLYFGVYLTAYLVPVGGTIAFVRRQWRSQIKPLLAAVAVVVVLAAPLAWPYMHVRSMHGERSYGETEFYSAQPHDYLTLHYTRTTYVNALGLGLGRGERELFPGFLAIVLTLVAVWPPFSAPRVAYALGLVFAFEASLGMHGYLYPSLTEHFLPFRGLRVPARYSMLVGLSLSVLAGYGTARLCARLRSERSRYVLAAVLASIVLFESRATLSFEHVPEPHAIYQWFDGRPTAVIAELPAPQPIAQFQWTDVRYSYPATFHWQRMLNGNSGYFPLSNVAFCAAVQTFPDDRSISLLQRRGVDYVIVHEEYYGRATYQNVLGAVGRRTELRQVACAQDRGYEARIYRLARATGNR